MARPASSPTRRSRGRTVAHQRSRLPRVGLVLIVAALAVAGLFVWQRSGGARDSTRWQPIATLPSEDVHAIVWHPTELNTVYAGHHGGVLRSEDGGRTWQATPLTDADAMSLSATPGAPGRMYAAGHGIFRRSDDGGVTWTTPSSSIQGADIHGFAQDPVTPDRLYALVVGQGLLMSVDGGITWTPRAQAPGGHAALAVSADGTTVLMATENRVEQSTDQGASWTVSGSDLPAGTQVLALGIGPERDLVFAATTTGLYRRAGTSGAWEPTPLGQGMIAVAVNPLQANRVLAVDQQKRVYRSDDGGATWKGATR